MLVDFGEPIGTEQAGQRPAVVVSADSLNESKAGVVIMIPLTTARRELPSHVEIEPGISGLNNISYAKCEDIKSISEQRLIVRLGLISYELRLQISRILRLWLKL